MKIRNTVILLFIFVVLAGYVYIVEVKQHSKKEKAEEKAKKVFTMPKDSVNTLKIRNANGEFLLKKVDQDWEISTPLETEADGSTINSMLTSLFGATKESVFDVQPPQMAQYGLTDQAVKVQVEDKLGEQDSLRLGDKTPVGANVFAAKTDTSIFTVSQSIKSQFEKKLFDIRDKKMLHFKRADVRTITIKNPHGTITIDKDGSSDWKLKNIDRAADNSKVSSLLSKLENNRVKAFVDENGRELKKYGLTRPAFQVGLDLGQDLGQRNLMISKKLNGKYYGKDEDRKPIFEIDSSLVKDVKEKVADFRSKDLASFNRSDVDRIMISYADTLFSCLKDTSDEWWLDEIGGKPLDKSKIQSFFSSLDYTNIAEFIKDGNIEPAKYGLSKPSLQISLYNGEDMIIQVKLGKIVGDNVYALTNQYDSVYLIPKSKIKDLKLKLSDIELAEKPETEPAS
jgi:hypothetical protein